MYKILLYITLFGTAIAAPNTEVKIVGGNDASPGQYPYMTSLRKNNEHICGGSIISKKHILTAAHCVYRNSNEPSIFAVQYGTIDTSNNENLASISSIHMHEGYSDDVNLRNDIAILLLENELEFGANVQPIKLPTPFETPDDYSPAISTGWGTNETHHGTDPTTLQYVDQVLFPQEYCTEKEKYFDEDVHVCSGVIGGGKGPCIGDSGGPLTVDGKQFGIVSWSIMPCAAPDHPVVLTKVTNYRDWIHQIAGI